MLTTLDLSETLLEEAMMVTNTHTKTAVITVALERLVRQSKVSGIKNYFGKLNLDIDLNTLRGRELSTQI
ncbi:MAG: type II toxin-antitoxin system VapB family antitoxin [Spirochaetaceae bacterium]|jgi:hypothetical protein|nr:type II toxin-antitoxin system VapB family antitoxin [Spirochaetaceae bacterium]